MSAAGRALSKALDSPRDWRFDGSFILTHEPSGLEFWVGLGGFLFDGHSRYQSHGNRSIGLIERHWLYFKAKKIIKSIRPNTANDLIARFKAAKK